jgi:nucleolar protein 6
MQQSADQQPVLMNFSFSMKKRKKGAAASQQQQPSSNAHTIGKESAESKILSQNNIAASASAGDKVKERSKPHKKARGSDSENETQDSKKSKSSVANAAQAEDSVTATKAKRFTLFVGNMPFSICEADVRQHFSQCSVVGCRLLRNKVTGLGKGIAFLDFSDSKGFLAALKLQHSLLGGRQINIEPTAGGGGNSSSRKDKIESKKKRFEKVIKSSAGGADRLNVAAKKQVPAQGGGGDQ